MYFLCPHGPTTTLVIYKLVCDCVFALFVFTLTCIVVSLSSIAIFSLLLTQQSLISALSYLGIYVWIYDEFLLTKIAFSIGFGIDWNWKYILLLMSVSTYALWEAKYTSCWIAFWDWWIFSFYHWYDNKYKYFILFTGYKVHEKQNLELVVASKLIINIYKYMSFFVEL